MASITYRMSLRKWKRKKSEREGLLVGNGISLKNNII